MNISDVITASPNPKVPLPATPTVPGIDDPAEPAASQPEIAWDFDQTPTYAEPEVP